MKTLLDQPNFNRSNTWKSASSMSNRNKNRKLKLKTQIEDLRLARSLPH